MSNLIVIVFDDAEQAGTYYLVLNVDTNGESTATPVDVVYQVTIDACTSAIIEIVREI